MVHVILGAALGGIGHGVGRLALGADEQDATALANHVADRLQRLVHQRHRLREVDDVDLVAGPVEERGHAGVPAMGLVPEVDAGFEKLAH